MTRGAATARPSAMPAFVPPCLAKLTDEVPIGEQWVHEIKFDGYRLQAHIGHTGIQLFTRTGLEWTPRFRKLADAFQKLKVKSAVIDGEAIVEDAHGVSSFPALVAELKSGRSASIVFMAFDLLFLNGRSLTALPLAKRKQKLSALLQGANLAPRIRYSDHLAGDGQTILAKACKLKLEGIISKRLDQSYRSGRHNDWLKSKCIQSDEFVIVGYVASTAIAHAVGALVLAYFDDKRLVYAGRVGTGFTRQSAGEIWEALQTVRTKSSPLPTALDAAQRRGVEWVKPARVAEVEYRAWTQDRLLRQAAFKGLREDLPANRIQPPQSLASRVRRPKPRA